jgi:23S rRNA pseudouridine2605 synthase
VAGTGSIAGAGAELGSDGAEEYTHPGPSRSPELPELLEPPETCASVVQPSDGAPIRLQKVLAAAGIASRRASEDLIASGRVEVDGQVVDRLGARVDPQTAVVRVDGRRISVRADLIYLALNKPQGVLSAMSDDRGRPTVGDLVRDYPQRLFHVGRLDADSEGLLLLTNDGQFAHQLMHPSHGVSKTYLVDVPGPVDREVGRRLRAGVTLADGPAAVDEFRIVQSAGERALCEVVLHEGRNRIVRRLMAEVGHPVSRLVRTQIGPLRLGSQRVGTVRSLSPDEVSSLYRSIDSSINS